MPQMTMYYWVQKMCICMPGNWGEYGCVRNVQYPFLFCGENDNANANALQCYVVRTLLVLLNMVLWFRLRIPSLFLQRRLYAEHENFWDHHDMNAMINNLLLLRWRDLHPYKNISFCVWYSLHQRKTNYVASQDWKGSLPCFGTNF